MKFLVICMFALVATSIAGEIKKEKRGLLGLGIAGFTDINGGYATAPLAHLTAAPALVNSYAPPALAAASLAPLTAAPALTQSYPAPAFAAASLAPWTSASLAASALRTTPVLATQTYIPSAPAPASTVQQVAQRVHQHTHTVERVNVPVPYQVDRTVVKHVPVDRPVPQPYPVEVIKHVPQPYVVDRPVPQPYEVRVAVPVPKPYAVPVERVQTFVEKLQVPHPVAVDRPVTAPYSAWPAASALTIQHHQQPALALHATPAAYGLRANAAYTLPTTTAHGYQGAALLAASPALGLNYHHHHGSLAYHF